MLKINAFLSLLIFIFFFINIAYAINNFESQMIPPISGSSNSKSSVVESISTSNKTKLIESPTLNVPALNVESINLAEIESHVVVINNNESHPQLPEQYSKDLLQELLTFVVNKKLATEEPKLTYNNESTVCVTKFVLSSIGQDNDKLFYYNYQNPSDHQIYSCFVNGLNQQKVQIDHGTGTAYMTFAASELHPNQVDFNYPNKPVYPLDSIYSNITAYQITGVQSAAMGVQQNSLSTTLANTTTMPWGALMHSYNINPDGLYPVNRGTTTWETDYQSSMTSLLLGDTTPSAGGWGSSIPFAGVHYGTNTTLRPNVNFQAQNPAFSGTLDNPSQIQMLANGQQIQNPLSLDAGPYSILNPPVSNGAGNLLVNLKTESGLIYQTMNIPYYNDASIFAKDLYLYEYNFGYPSNGTGANGLNLDYNTTNAIFSTTHTYGLTNYYTPQIHLEAQQNNFVNLGLTHNFTVLDYLYFSVSNALSQNNSGMGYLNQLTVSHQPIASNALQTSYSVVQTSDNFNNLSGINTDQVSQTFSLSTSTSYGLTLSGNYSLNTSISSGNSSIASFRALYQISKLLTQIGVTQTNTTSTSSLGLFLNLSYSLQNSSYSASAQSQNNQNSYTTNYQYNDPSNIWNANLGNQYTQSSSTPNTINAGGGYNFSNATANTSVSYSDGNNYSNVNTLSGNMVIARNGINFGRSSTGSFAIVQVGLPNIGILQGDTYIGSTDRNGEFIMPNLTPYFAQIIKIRQDDLPLNTSLDHYSETVIPPLNGGVMITFKATHYSPATTYLRYDKNKIPPPGFNADIIDNDTHKVVDQTIIADSGMILINKFEPSKSYTVEFVVQDGTYDCKISEANIDKKSSNEYNTVLKDVVCTQKK